MKYWCSYFVDLTQKQNSQVIKNPKMDEEFEKYCTVFEYYTTRRLHQYFFVFLQSVSRQIGQKKSQQTLLQLTMDLINKGNFRREFCSNGIIYSSAIQFLSTTGQKKPTKKAKTPNPVLLNCTTEYLKKGNVNAIFTILDYAFLKCTLSSRVGFFKV